VARGKRQYTAAEQRFQQRLGERIKTLRTEANLVQDDFADRAHLDRSSMSPMEKGRYDVRLSTLLRVAGTLGVRADELLRQVLDGEEGA
jgi:transcriptional regulator with XRE-family HTH domain